MATVAFIGEGVRVEGYRLAGALVYPAEDEPSVRRAWEALGPDVAVAVLTPRAAHLLGLPSPRPGGGPGDGPRTNPIGTGDSPGGGPLTVVMPS